MSTSVRQDDPRVAERIQQFLETSNVKMISGKYSTEDYAASISQYAMAYRSAYANHIPNNAFIARVGRRLNDALKATGQTEQCIDLAAPTQTPKSTRSGTQNAAALKTENIANRKIPIPRRPNEGTLDSGLFRLVKAMDRKTSYNKFESLSSN